MSKHWATRKVKNGKVKINGRYFAPEEKYQPYDGRFEGMRLVFGLYWNPYGNMMDYVYLWGTEELSNCIKDNPDGNLDDEYRKENELMSEGNTLPYKWWRVAPQ